MKTYYVVENVLFVKTINTLTMLNIGGIVQLRTHNVNNIPMNKTAKINKVEILIEPSLSKMGN